MAHRSSRRRGEPTARDIKRREAEARRQFERAQQKREKKDPPKAREASHTEELK